ncbi:MAG: hypothetical protein JNK78_11760, partial [Planctomycetes bacterium]|nr:hypothetical protein [Planctomycetota bacterium]
MQALSFWRVVTTASAGLVLALACVPASAQCAIQAGGGLEYPPAAASGLNGTVHALARLSTGELIAAGSFTAAGGVACNRIARWDGWQWWPLGSGLDGDVRALAILPDGHLVAGGAFTTAGGSACSRIARWDGATWSAIGSGADASVLSLAVLPNGDLLAGGDFLVIGGVTATRIARWNGAAWAGFPVFGYPLTSTRALAAMPDGTFVAGGNGIGGTTTYITRWNGTAWAAMGTGMNGAVEALARTSNGDIVAGGAFTTAGGISCSRIARWNGTTWASFGLGMNSSVRALLPMDGGLLAGGDFGMKCWDGTLWQNIGNGVLRALIACGAGGVAGGDSECWPWVWLDTPWSTTPKTFVHGSFRSQPPMLMESVDAVTVAPSGSLVVDYRKYPGGGIQPANTQLFDGLGWIQIACCGHGTSEVPGKGKTVAGRRDGSIWIGGLPDDLEGLPDGPSLWLWGTNTPVSGPPPTLYPNLAEISCIVELPDNRVAVGL